MDQTTTVSCDMSGSAQWVSLVDAKDDVPTFNMQNIVACAQALRTTGAGLGTLGEPARGLHP